MVKFEVGRIYIYKDYSWSGRDVHYEATRRSGNFLTVRRVSDGREWRRKIRVGRWYGQDHDVERIYFGDGETFLVADKVIG